MHNRPTATEFTRLSAWSILHYTARTLYQLVGNAFAVIPLIYGAYTIDDFTLVSGGVFLLSIAVVGGAVLRHLYFSYLIDEQSVQVRQGVFSKKT
ncbi:MAG: hypothetical protein O3A63_18480 [Proteobacteria bacterium]|nr:hypothetical protein [Pseudomonadota bacterium]